MGVCTLKDFNQPGPEVCFAFDVWKYKGPIGFNLVESRRKEIMMVNIKLFFLQGRMAKGQACMLCKPLREMRS